MQSNLAQSLELQLNDVPALKKTENLPFTIRIARDSESMEKAVRIRREAYGRHLPDLAASMTQPDEADFAPGTTVLLAESKLDGKALGTMRIQTNEFNSLKLETSFKLPEPYKNSSLAESTRLGTANGRAGPLVKAVLFKSFYMFCCKKKVDYMIITARKPLDRQYEHLLFQDVDEQAGYIPMQHVGGIGHKVMYLKTENVYPWWKEKQHSLFSFFFEMKHPDIILN